MRQFKLIAFFLLTALVGFSCSDSSSCPGTQTKCEDYCADLMTDEKHCGECGNECGSEEICIEGSCVLLCPDGLTECSGSCVDTNTDPNNCGGCGVETNTHVCPQGTVCNGAGVCELTCQEGLTECNGECVNLLTDSRFCSNNAECGAPCPQGTVCNGAGVCELTCQEGLTECNGECVNLLTDSRFCSDNAECGAPCPQGTVCNGAGVCELTCQEGLTHCGGICTDTSFDPNNCGGCGNEPNPGDHICASDATTVGYCTGGQCEFLCAEGYTDCDGDSLCESDLQNDLNNCGACGNQCAVDCENGACREYCSDLAIDWCLNKGWTVVGEPDNGNIVCTIDGRGTGSNCDPCGFYNIIVWIDGSPGRHCPGYNYSTLAGNVYSGHSPCQCGDNLDLCTSWDMQNCIPD